MSRKCTICNNYNFNTEECSRCEFEYGEELYWNRDDFDIFKIDDEYEWSHLQMMRRLKSEGIECLYADMWWDNNLAIVIGADASRERVASALNVHRDCVYDLGTMPMYILNLLQEKLIRLGDGEFKVKLNVDELVEYLSKFDKGDGE